MNRLLELYRRDFPGDQRGDDDVLLDLAKQRPDLIEQFPDAKADLARIAMASAPTSPTPPTAQAPGALDYAKQAYGRLVRGFSDSVAGLPEALAIGSKMLADETGFSFGQPDDLEDFGTWKIAQGIRSAGEAVTPEEDERLRESFWASDVPGAIGSAVGFMAGGGIGKGAVQGGIRAASIGAVRAGASKGAVRALAGVANATPIALMGMAANGAGAFKEAVAHGASDEDAYKVFLWNAGVGASEAIPLSRFLNRLDGIGGGGLKRALLNATKETFEESLQEAFQQISQNAAARRYYDENRDLLDGVARSAGAGGVTGALLSLLSSALGARARGVREQARPEAGKEDETHGQEEVPEEGPQVGTTGRTVEINPAEQYREPSAEAKLTDEQKAELTALAARKAAGEGGEDFLREELNATDLYPGTDEQRRERRIWFKMEFDRLKAARDAASAAGTPPPGAGTPPPGTPPLGSAPPPGAGASAPSGEGVPPGAGAPPPGTPPPGAGATPPGGESEARSKADEETRRKEDEARRKAAESGPDIPKGKKKPGFAPLSAEAQKAAEEGRYWELLPDEFLSYIAGIAAAKGQRVYNPRVILDKHWSWVQRAIREGKPVPKEVLAFYPDLAEAQEKGTFHAAATDYGREPEDPDTNLVEVPVDETGEMPDIEGEPAEPAQPNAPIATTEPAAIPGVAGTANVPPVVETVAPAAQPPSAAQPEPAWKKLVREAKAILGNLDLGAKVAQRTGAGGGGTKSAATFVETTDADILFDDVAHGKDNKQTRKLVILQSPDGTHVMVGTAYESGKAGPNRRKVAAYDAGGTVVGKSYQKLLAEGWKPIGAIKTKEATRDFVATFSSGDWGPILEELRATNRERAGGLEVAESVTVPELKEQAVEVASPNAPVFEWQTAKARGGTLPFEQAAKLLDAIGGPKWENAEEAREQITGGLTELPIAEQEFILRAMSPRDRRSAEIDMIAGLDVLAERIYEGYEQGGREGAERALTGEKHKGASKVRNANPAQVLSTHGEVRSEGTDAGRTGTDEAEAGSDESESDLDESEVEEGAIRVDEEDDSWIDRLDEEEESEEGWDDEVVFRAVESDEADFERSRDIAQRFNAALDGLAAAGVNVRLLSRRLAGLVAEFRGATRTIRMSLVDLQNPTLENLVTLIHEAGHDVFARESPGRQAMLRRAMGMLSNEALGITGLKVRVGAGQDPGTIIPEERLVEAAARHLAASGFDPKEARGIAKAIMRWLKDVYSRVVMAVQFAARGWLGNPGRAAMSYFENRLKMELAGDARYSFIAWMGGPKLRVEDTLDVSDLAAVRYAEVSGEVDNYATVVENLFGHARFEQLTRPKQPSPAGFRRSSEAGGIEERLSPAAKRALGDPHLAAATDIIARSARSYQATAAATNPANRRERYENDRRIREVEEAALREWAQANGLMLDSVPLLEEWRKQGEAGGAEQKVIFDPNRQVWTKINDAVMHRNWADYFRRFALHAALFPETAYKFVGFTEVDGKLAAVVEQADVQFGRGATREEVEANMAKRGFVRYSHDDYYNPESGVVVQDLHNENAVVRDGKIVCIDPIPYVPDVLDFAEGGMLAGQKPPAWMPRPNATLRDVWSTLDEASPTGVLPIAANLKELAARAFAAIFGKTVVAADGSRIKIENRRWGRAVDFFNHLTSKNALSRTNEAPVFDPEKASWITMIERTLRNAQVRLVDGQSRIYVRRYRGGITHMVVVDPTGELANYKLTTQFPRLGVQGSQFDLKIDWPGVPTRPVQSTVPSGSQAAGPIQPRSLGAGPIQAGQPNRSTSDAGVKYRVLSGVSDEETLVSAEQDATALLERDVAAQNTVRDAMRLLYDAWDGLGHNTAGLTFEQWLETKNFVSLPRDPAEVIVERNRALANAGKAAVNPDTRLGNVVNKSLRQRATAVALKRLQNVWTALTKRRNEAEWLLSSDNKSNLVDRLARRNKELHQLYTDYTNADTIFQAAKARVGELLVTLRKSAGVAVGAATKLGTLEQVIRDLNGKISRPLLAQYEKALNKLYARLSGDPDAGRRFTDILERVANLGIDWSKPSAEIRDEILLVAQGGEPLLQGLLEPGVDAQALLSVLVAFGKSNRNVMDLLQLRRSDAISDRAVVNAAFKKAMEDHKDALAEAKAMVRKLPRLATVADRLLSELEEARKENRELMDQIVRERAFIDFHQDTSHLLRAEMAKLESELGVVEFEWEAVDQAEYLVPPTPTATIEQVESSRRTLRLTAGGMLASDIRADMLKMRQWLDATPRERGGAVWEMVNRQYNKLSFLSLDMAHHAIQGSWVNRLIAPLTDRLRFVGTPAARAAARRLEQMTFWISSKSRDAHQLGVRWEVAEQRAMKAVGIKRRDVFREVFYSGALGFIEKRQDILAKTGDPKKAEAEALRELLAYYQKNPETSALVMRRGAWAALSAYYRQTAVNATWIEKNRREMGLKVQDEIGYRETIGAVPFTVLRGISQAAERIFKRMQPVWSDRLDKDKMQQEYEADPDAFRKQMRARFSKEIWQRFVRPIVMRTGRSAFYAPELPDGTRLMANRGRVIAAFEQSGGDAVKFAETLYRLEGGTPGTEAEFVAETLETFQSFYDALNGVFADQSQASDVALMPVPRRYLMDARKSEEFPTEWLDYHPMGIHALRQISKMQAYHAAFGRNMEAMREDLAAATAEQRELLAKLREFEQKHRDKTGKRLREAVAKEARAAGINPIVLENASRNLQALGSAERQFNAMLTINHDRPVEINAWSEIVSTLAGLAVSGPATALTDTIAIVEQPFRKLGLSLEAARMLVGGVKDAAGIAAQSFFNAFGITVAYDAEHVRLANELGFFDDDATVALKDRLKAAMSEDTSAKNPLLRAAVYVSRAIRVGLGAGLGTARPGVPIVPTLKPNAFAWQAQVIHLGQILTWWKTYERIVAKAVLHFQRNPTALNDPKFEFKPKDVGMRDGRAYDYLRESMSRYGLNLEQIAREAALRRSKNPRAPLLTRDQYRALAMQGQNEVTLETGMSTRPPGFMTNPVLNMVNPLLGWSIEKSYDVWRGLRGPNGEKSKRALRAGLMAYAAILPTALAYALMRDWFDEEVIGRKQNVMRIGQDEALLALLDNTVRVGTFGVFGEIPNAFLNVDTQRELSVDSRVFFVNSLLNTFRAAQTFWQQDFTADWQTVYRPLAQSLGGSGYLQYADSLNNLLGLDNAEARVCRRISVNNYLRAAGRALDMDVRTGRGMRAIPNPIKPYVGQMVLAAYANDPVEFARARRAAVTEARKEGKPDPEEYVARSFSAYHPLRYTFRTVPSEAEYRRLLQYLSDDGRVAVATAVRLYNGYSEQIGASTTEGARSSRASLGATLPTLPSIPRLDLEKLRKKAAIGIN